MHSWYHVWGIVYLWHQARVCIWFCSSMQMYLLIESIATVELAFETGWERSQSPMSDCVIQEKELFFKVRVGCCYSDILIVVENLRAQRPGNVM